MRISEIYTPEMMRATAKMAEATAKKFKEELEENRQRRMSDMAAIPPNTNLEGFKKSMCEGIEGVFRKGVIHGRYLLQQELGIVRCRNCEFAAPDPIGREDVLFCDEWERFTTRFGYCHKASKKKNEAPILHADEGEDEA